MWELFKWLFDKKDSESSESKSWWVFSTIKDILGFKNGEESKSSQKTNELLNELKQNLNATASYLNMEQSLSESDIDNSLKDKDDWIGDFFLSYIWFWSNNEFSKYIDEMIEKIDLTNSPTSSTTLTSNLEKLKTGSKFSFLTNSKNSFRSNIGKFFEKSFGNETETLFADINKELKELQAGTMLVSSWNNITSPENYENLTSIQSLRWKIFNPFEKWGTITSLFGEDRDDHDHQGIDLAKSGKRQPLFAAARMQITKNVYQDKWAWNQITAMMIDNLWNPVLVSGKKIFFNYFHLSERPPVDEWEIIEPGVEFAFEWNTGHSKWEHLHFELKLDDESVDPLLAFNPDIFTYKQDGKIVAFEDWKHADEYEDHDHAA